MPPLFIMLPPNVNSGRASSAKESMPEKHRCAATGANTAGSMLNSAVMMDAMPMPAEMGTPMSSRMKENLEPIWVAGIMAVRSRTGP